MAACERDLRAAEARVEQLLTRMFPATPNSVGWKGWRFTAPAGIDVYLVKDSPGAAAQLHAVGFDPVTLHGHRAERFLSCTCHTREASP